MNPFWFASLVAVLALVGGLILWLWLAARSRITALKAVSAEREKAAADRESLLVQADHRLREAFASASREALQLNNQAFLDLARASMGEFQEGARLELEARREAIHALVSPVEEKLQRVDDVLRTLDRDRATTQATLVEHLRHLSEGQARLAGETESLARALRAPQVRGQWGEMQLRRAVELAGMLEHCDFIEQHTIQGEDGRLRPDLVVRLPRGKVVVVDAKAPLSAYLDAVESTDEAARSAHLDRHAMQVRAHIKALAGKEYANQFSTSPDFVVLFLPGEAFFSAAAARDPSLVDDAIRLGVIPASPTTLITVLKAVSYGWQEERIAERAEQIRDLGIELYERVGSVAEHLARVRKGLDATVGAYNSAVGSLESRFLPTARRLRDLGVDGGKEVCMLEPVDAAPRAAVALELIETEAA